MQSASRKRSSWIVKYNIADDPPEEAAKRSQRVDSPLSVNELMKSWEYSVSRRCAIVRNRGNPRLRRRDISADGRFLVDPAVSHVASTIRYLRFASPRGIRRSHGTDPECAVARADAPRKARTANTLDLDPDPRVSPQTGRSRPSRKRPTRDSPIRETESPRWRASFDSFSLSGGRYCTYVFSGTGIIGHATQCEAAAAAGAV